MFCVNCGSKVEGNEKICPNCGAPINANNNNNANYNTNNSNEGFNNFTNSVNHAFDNAEQSLGSAVNDVKQSFNNAGQPYRGEALNTNRSLLGYIVLSIITCGIYSYYFIYKLAYDVNIACDGDGEKTGGLVAFIVLSFITCGIYALIWYYKLGNRLAENAPRYNLHFSENGTTILMWYLFGALICGIGPFIAMHILIKNTNKICSAYNYSRGLI